MNAKEMTNTGLLNMPTLHPLNLLFLANLDDTKLNTEFAETITRQRLCQDVSELFLCSNMLNPHPPISNTISDEMITHINVFASIMKDGILTKGDCRLSVHLQEERGTPLAVELCKQLCQPDPLAGGRCTCNVLSFAGREGDHLLFL